MFFIASKLFWLLAGPINLSIFGALFGLFAIHWWPRARIVALISVAALAVMDLTPVGALLLRPLEARFPPPAADMAPPYGILVLGGAIDAELSAQHGSADLQEGASRLTEAALLARRYRDARVFYTGGSPWTAGGASGEAEVARQLLIGLGVAPERIGIEDRSRNTDENARFSAKILKPQPGQRWLLVTSAYHMPRSMGLFRKAGFDVTAYPVDFRTAGDARDYRVELFRVNELSQFDLAVHEWTGLTAYYLTGKIRDWFPAP